MALGAKMFKALIPIALISASLFAASPMEPVKKTCCPVTCCKHEKACDRPCDEACVKANCKTCCDKAAKHEHSKKEAPKG
jgi:hypothetical protein